MPGLCPQRIASKAGGARGFKGPFRGPPPGAGVLDCSFLPPYWWPCAPGPGPRFRPVHTAGPRPRRPSSIIPRSALAAHTTFSRKTPQRPFASSGAGLGLQPAAAGAARGSKSRVLRSRGGAGPAVPIAPCALRELVWKANATTRIPCFIATQITLFACVLIAVWMAARGGQWLQEPPAT
jgi:hypothetical protein